jgi:hypothetical protein
VVLDDSEYRDKLNLLLDSGVYEPLSKDPNLFQGFMCVCTQVSGSVVSN